MLPYKIAAAAFLIAVLLWIVLQFWKFRHGPLGWVSFFSILCCAPLGALLVLQQYLLATPLLLFILLTLVLHLRHLFATLKALDRRF